MTRDEVMKLAGEAGYTFADEKSPLLVNHGEWQRRLCERFAALVAGSEREACAKRLEAVGCDHCAANIRARGEK
jgi:hypothetical protein